MTTTPKRAASRRASVPKTTRPAETAALLPFDLPAVEAKPTGAVSAARPGRKPRLNSAADGGNASARKKGSAPEEKAPHKKPARRRTKAAGDTAESTASKSKERVTPVATHKQPAQGDVATVSKAKTRTPRQSPALPDNTRDSLPFALNKTHQMDCIEAMRGLPDACVDVAIADPPYNASKGGNWSWDNSIKLPGFGGNWSKIMADWDDMPLAEYFVFTMGWLSELKRVVRPSGSIWIHGTYHNIGLINFALQLLSVEIINEVIWFKRNSFPNLSGRRLTASHESILWAHTGGEKRRRYFFAYDKSKSMNCEGDRIKEPGKQMRTVWDIPNNKAREEIALGKHPTQKPIRLLTRMLELSAQPGQLVLVPFAGSGADCVAAQRLGLDFLAFETEAEFVQLANTRVEHEKTKGSVDLGA